MLEKEYYECQRMYSNYPNRQQDDPGDFYRFIMYYRSHNLALRSERHMEFVKKNRYLLGQQKCYQHIKKREEKIMAKHFI